MAEDLSPLSQNLASRYVRQASLPDIGDCGQAKLIKSSVLIVGAGGLGVPSALYLAGAGIGKIGIIDHDCIELTNLHRQVIYTESDIGKPKSSALAKHLRKLNSNIDVVSYEERLLSKNAAALVEEYDLVIDAADNFLVTYLLSDLCLAKGKSLISASVIGSKGYIGVFCHQAPSYRALFPNVPEQAQSCSEAGVLGPIVGVLGNMQAQEAIKLILDSPMALKGKLLTIDLWQNRQSQINFSEAPEPEHYQPIELIDESAITDDDLLIDVRNEIESQSSPVKGALNIPLPQISENGHNSLLKGNRRRVFFCVSGRRAAQAALSMRSEINDRIAVLYRS